MQPELIEKLSRAGRKHKLFEPAAADALDLNRCEIERLVPHRDPFLFVDRITAVNLSDATIAGHRRIDPFDPLFQGHFPGDPIYPGVLQVETMGQLGLCLFGLLKNERASVRFDDRPHLIRGVKIHHAVFLEPVRPGDRLIILAKVLESDEYTGICAGQLLNGSKVCSFGITEVYFVGD
jgi:3-hydroxyacyl-[acyl-carrier-protein] dehydratase